MGRKNGEPDGIWYEFRIKGLRPVARPVITPSSPWELAGWSNDPAAVPDWWTDERSSESRLHSECLEFHDGNPFPKGVDPWATGDDMEHEEGSNEKHDRH